MRIVLDTNVVLSALLWRGAPYALVELVRREDRLKLFSSLNLVEELADVLTRPSPARRLALIGRAAHQILADYLDAVELVLPASIPSVVPDDPDDDQVIAAAVAAGADLIVSGDRHLLALQSHLGIRIVTPLTRLAYARHPADSAILERAPFMRAPITGCRGRSGQGFEAGRDYRES